MFWAAALQERMGDRLVVIPGDFTMAGEPDEYEAAIQFVDAVLAADLRLVITPGNHDFGGVIDRRLVADGPRDRYRALARRLRRWWESHPAEGVHVLSEDAMDSLTRIGDHVFLSLRSVHSHAWLKSSARVRREQIEWAKSALSEHQRPGDHLHFVTHRSIWRHDVDDKHPAMRKSERLCQELLQPFRFRTYIHGHNHVARDVCVPLPFGGASIRHISVPTLSNRHGGGVSGGAGVLSCPLGSLAG